MVNEALRQKVKGNYNKKMRCGIPQRIFYGYKVYFFRITAME